MMALRQIRSRLLCRSQCSAGQRHLLLQRVPYASTLPSRLRSAPLTICRQFASSSSDNADSEESSEQRRMISELLNTPSMQSKLNLIVKQHHSLENTLSETVSTMAASEIAAVSKQIDSLSGIANAYRALEDARKQRLETLGMLETDGKDDAEMREMLQEELTEMDRVIQSREKDLVAELIPRDDVDMADAMLEIRAATGGDEAGLFANEVLKMYERFAQVEGWDFELLSINMEGGNDRLKEGIANISGRGVFGRLKFESGVHRVQRVPQTESKGRVHTSTITVAVMPHASEISSVELRDEDLRIDVFRASGAGGQHVNKTESAVRITHLPSGIAVAVQEERSQHQNKARAMTILKTKLYDIQRAEAAKKRRSTRNSMIGSGTRSEKIRTYNFPQGRVTDHRIGYSTRNIDAIMNATSLGELIDKLRIHYELELLGNAISEQQEQSSSS